MFQWLARVRRGSSAPSFRKVRFDETRFPPPCQGRSFLVARLRGRSLQEPRERLSFSNRTYTRANSRRDDARERSKSRDFCGTFYSQHTHTHTRTHTHTYTHIVVIAIGRLTNQPGERTAAAILHAVLLARFSRAGILLLSDWASRGEVGQRDATFEKRERKRERDTRFTG